MLGDQRRSTECEERGMREQGSGNGEQGECKGNYKSNCKSKCGFFDWKATRVRGFLRSE
jgi:hypothetical protein